jgi:cytochrome c oxidase assembly protein subunit 15
MMVNRSIDRRLINGNALPLPVAQRAEPELKKSAIVLAFASIGLVYTVMLIGVFLSNGPIHEQGIVCTDWPLCPNGFGVPEERYLFEYVHRVVAVIAASTVYATAIVVPSSIKKAKKAAVIAAVIVTAQVIIGYLTVITGLNPLVVASHLSTGITVFAFGLLTFWWTGIWKKYWH